MDELSSLSLKDPFLFEFLPGFSLLLLLDGCQTVKVALLLVEDLAVPSRGEVRVLFVPGWFPTFGVNREPLLDCLLFLCVGPASLSNHIRPTTYVNHY